MTNNGIKITDKYIPIESVGIYVPGGKYPYPSTVLMSAIPAKVAGVKNIYMVTPSTNLTASVFAAAAISGVDRIFKIGGPQAIAALAFGTETVPKVDKIVGPGNSYVQQAKFLLSAQVGIDMIAGPSEVVIIADGAQNPDWIATDLMAQLEHSDDSKATLITDDEKLIEKVQRHIKANKPMYVPTMIKVEDMAEAVKKSNEIAPEHLQLMLENKVINQIKNSIKNAGAVFVGKWTPVSIGDYWAGPSHVLPTGGAARFQEGLNVRNFVRKVSFIECSAEGIKKSANSISKFAETEGMEYHGQSILKRIEK